MSDIPTTQDTSLRECLRMENTILSNELSVPINKLDTAVESVINLISDTKIHTETIKTFGVDTRKMPLGKISDKIIDKAHEIFKNISEIIITENDEDIAELDELSAEFWTLIPYSCGRNKSPPIIDTLDQISTYADLLDAMKNSQIAAKIMSNPDNNNNSFNIYNTLGSEIEICNDVNELSLIKNFISGTHAPTHHYSIVMEEVFRLKEKY